MLEKIRSLNPDIPVYSIHDAAFRKYGCVLNIDTAEIVEACARLERPESGSRYEATVPALESLGISDKLREIACGGCAAQIGITHGCNSLMNGLEYHKSSEINIAATPQVLILGCVYGMDNNQYDSSKAEAFYLETGDAVEVYATSLHFCPCQVEDSGFSCVVVLPKDTNTELEKASDDRLLFKKNKWLICHNKNQQLIDRGVYPGIFGQNYKITY